MHTSRFPAGPLDGAAVFIDTDLPVVAVAVLLQMPDGRLNMTLNRTADGLSTERLCASLRGTADIIERQDAKNGNPFDK